MAKNKNFIKPMKKQNPKNDFKAKMFFSVLQFPRSLPFFITGKPKEPGRSPLIFMMNLPASKAREKPKKKGKKIKVKRELSLILCVRSTWSLLLKGISKRSLQLLNHTSRLLSSLTYTCVVSNGPWPSMDCNQLHPRVGFRHFGLSWVSNLVRPVLRVELKRSTRVEFWMV